MSSPPLTDKPKATAEGLPTELWTLICHSRSSYSDGEDFIIDFISLFSLHSTSKTLRKKTRDAFLQRHLASLKFSLMPWSLDVLKELSEDEQLHSYVRELEFGPEVLNTNLEVDLQYVREQGGEPSTGYPHPESYIYVDSARPVWPMVKLPEPLWQGNTARDSGSALVVRWNEQGSYGRWLQKYGDTLRKLVYHQNHFRARTGYIREAIAKFPMLKSININPRPVGTYYEERFAKVIRRSRGTTPLFRELGAHELKLTTDAPPYGSESILEFSLDGLLFMEYYAEINMLENLFDVLSSVDLGKLTVDLTITASNLLSNGRVFDTNHRTWTAMAPRVRSLTFDFAMSDVNIYQVLPLLTWITEMVPPTSAVEHFFGRNLSFGYFVLRKVLAQSSWMSLQTLHLFQCRIHGRDLLGMFLRHLSTLEDVNLSRVTTTGMSIASWRNMILPMKGMTRLERVTLDRLELQGANDMSGLSSYPWNSKPATCYCLKAKGYENVRHILDIATERMILVPGRNSTVCEVHFRTSRLDQD
ncbi:hypothetical protein G6011_03579 [Alternaria panax]|uniref:Uncharacterized protein n=1 Tax=Alternaria panax TaxID=48097 RepID=A0AAD4IFG7_9PLEO|nr:hypothetical protein G6011_03579 [Alternaria panax]